MSIFVETLEARTLLSAVRIMPLGDSITEGWNDNTRVSYRFWLWKKLQLAGYDVDFVGTKTGVFAGTPIYTDWDQNHQGTSGQLADQLAAGVTGWANTAQPDIALLHIGTNDFFQGQSVASTITDVNHIIDNIRVARPNISILLAKIIPSTQHTTEINQFNAQIPGVVAAKDTPQSRVILVDQASGFSASGDTFDGIHPIARGERKMANKWYNALTTLLPAPATAPPPAVTYLSDLTWAAATNGFGPVELDQSVGDIGADDGGAVWLNGITYPKGLGTHAASQIVYNIGGQYARFLASVGIDDDAGAQGSAVFQIFADDVKIYDSGLMTGSSATKQIDVPVSGTQQLKLVVTDGGDNIDWDHGDWANARLTTQPTVAASSFDFDTAPHGLSFTFRGNVSGSLSTTDLTLMNLTTNTPVPAASIALDYNTTTNVATFTFPGFTGGIIPDARYRATLVASGITDAAGNPMPSNFVADFFFLTADANHDGTVDLLDFNPVSEHFGLSSQTFGTGDFNYDGSVNLIDFNLLAGKFGSSLSPLARGTSSAKAGRGLLIDSLRADLLD